MVSYIVPLGGGESEVRFPLGQQGVLFAGSRHD